MLYFSQQAMSVFFSYLCWFQLFIFQLLLVTVNTTFFSYCYS